MSLCPNCHQMDKNFFAPQCHNCNEYVGFIEQCVHSLLWTVTYVSTVILVMYLVYKLIT